MRKGQFQITDILHFDIIEMLVHVGILKKKHILESLYDVCLFHTLFVSSRRVRGVGKFQPPCFCIKSSKKYTLFMGVYEDIWYLEHIYIG